MPITDGLAGQFPLGTSPAQAPSAPRPKRPAALRFNPLTRDFDKDANGRYVELHPVDAGVAYTLLMRKGAIWAASTAGNTLNQVRSPLGDTVQTDVEDRVRTALKRFLDAGDITILAITQNPVGPNGLAVRVDYINNRLLPKTQQTVFVPNT